MVRLLSGAAAADTTAPALSTATVNGASLVLTYDEALDTGSVPAVTAYTVSVGGTAVTLAGASPVAVSGMTVTLTLAAAVAAGDTVTVTYTAPAANPVQDAADNGAAALTNREVTNNTPATPTLSIADASGSEADGVEFTVTLSPASTGTVTVMWSATASGRERRHRRGGRPHGHADRYAELYGRRHRKNLHGEHHQRLHRRR